jgi:hypothetical protein
MTLLGIGFRGGKGSGGRAVAVVLAGVISVVAVGPRKAAAEGKRKLAPPVMELVLPAEGAWSRYEVLNQGFSKKMRFLDLETSLETVVRFKGIPYSRMTPVNIFVDPDVFEKRVHRARFRGQHPLTGEPLVLEARSTSRRYHSLPERSPDTAPVVEIFSGEDQAEALGSLTYDYHSKILFAGELRGQRVEIERLDEGLALEHGLWKDLLFPFPLTGEFSVRLDGEEAARFVQLRQRGSKTHFDLALSDDAAAETRQDAMVAFVIFGLMMDFVSSS